MTDDRPPDVHAAPHIVLDEDGLDRLELVLGGWLPGTVLNVGAGQDDGLILTDRENSPLAWVRPGAGDGDEPEIRVIRPLARGSGPAWEPGVRLPLAAVRERLAPAPAGAVACIVDDVPTRSDRAALRRAVEDANVIVVIALVSRRAPRAGRVGAAGIARSAWALADSLGVDRPPGSIVRLALPWPADRSVEVRGILRAARIEVSATISDLRSGEDQDRLDDLAGYLDREVDELYPPEAAREVLSALRSAPVRGAVVFFTGLSGSGKSTIARALADALADEDPRPVTLLDGDEVRHHLSRGLGFDAESRAANIDRIAWVAALVAAHGGIAIAAPIAPFAEGRRAARAMAEPHGAFLLVHVSTPLAVCEERDRKGLYARARAGEVPEFTGISSPYETPDDADITIDTTSVDVDDAVARIRRALESST
jgi:sulfate adenylyltransferase